MDTYDLNPWIFEGTAYNPEELDPKKIYGFVYKITDTITGKFYLGKKFFFKKVVKTVKGKKKKTVAESDWKKYWGSNEPLKEDIRDLGNERFIREIIHMCETKAECGYLEAYEQMRYNCILVENCYNNWISAKVTRMHMNKISSKIVSKFPST